MRMENLDGKGRRCQVGALESLIQFPEKIPPEEGWLLLLVRPLTWRPSVEDLRAAAGKVRCWIRALKISHENGLAPLLTSNLPGLDRNETGLAYLAYSGTLKQCRNACLARSTSVVFHITPLLRDPHEAGVPNILTEGSTVRENRVP